MNRRSTYSILYVCTVIVEVVLNYSSISSCNLDAELRRRSHPLAGPTLALTMASFDDTRYYNYHSVMMCLDSRHTVTLGITAPVNAPTHNYRHTPSIVLFKPMAHPRVHSPPTFNPPLLYVTASLSPPMDQHPPSVQNPTSSSPP